MRLALSTSVGPSLPENHVGTPIIVAPHRTPPFLPQQSSWTNQAHAVAVREKGLWVYECRELGLVLALK